MRGRETKRAPPSTDLLVCFPSRTHLALMPKPASSPVKPSDNKNHAPHHRHRHHNNLRLRISSGGGSSRSSRKATPLLWAKNKQTNSEMSEPSSPKVTCAGQIKVRSKSTSKNWQSVMEEIEKIHNNNNTRQRKTTTTWMESLGFKKEVMQFLTCLRNIRFDFRCFGAFPHTDIISSDDDADDDDTAADEDDDVVVVGDETSPRTWFMLLQENRRNNSEGMNDYNESVLFDNGDDCETGSVAPPPPPPPNALMLMRCRSAPAKSWRDDKEEEREENDDHNKKRNDLRSLMEDEKINYSKDKLVLMKYDTDFYKISSDIAKETWVVDGMNHLLSRSRSSKR